MLWAWKYPLRCQCLGWAELSTVRLLLLGTPLVRERYHCLNWEHFPTGEIILLPLSFRDSSLVFSVSKHSYNGRIHHSWVFGDAASQLTDTRIQWVIKFQGPELSLPTAHSPKDLGCLLWELFACCALTYFFFNLNLQQSPQSSQCSVLSLRVRVVLQSTSVDKLLTCCVVLQGVQCQLCILPGCELVSEGNPAHQN